MTHTTLTALFGEIANAIREKMGVSDTLLADDFPRLIRGMNVSGIYNHIPYSKDASGNIFNDCGFKTNYRLNSSGNEVAETGYEITGFMPAKKGNVIKFYNMNLSASDSASYLHFYDINKTFLWGISGYNLNANSNTYFSPVITSGTITQVTLANTSNSTVNTHLSKLAYIRISSPMITNNSVITIT